MDLCNRSDIEALLRRHGFHFSKGMGQNFLIEDWVPRDTAEACGAHGVIIPKRHSAGLTAAAVKSSAGAAVCLPVVRVANLVSTMQQLKTEKNVWFTCADMDGQNWCQLDFKGAVGLVIGSEGSGVSRLVREECDFVAALPMQGQINSLNASVAGGIILYEITRQRLGLKAK